MGRRIDPRIVAAVLQEIRAFKSERGISPSVRDLKTRLNLKSTSLVQAYLNRLEEEGLIRRDRRLSRSIVILSPASSQPGTIDKKKQAAGKKGRGVDPFNSVRQDLSLEARIDLVVEQARQKSSAGIDVIRGPVSIRLDGLRASRVG